MRAPEYRIAWALVLGIVLCGSAGAEHDEKAGTSAMMNEPTNRAEAETQNRYADKITPEEYAKWLATVKALPPEEQEWMRTLEQQLGDYYGPPYMKERSNGKTDPANDCWAYVKDDPRLPRVLLIGDSISRSYTAAARKALAGRANVHRAPANCGGTDAFFANGEIWLKQNGSAQWDFVVVNFGIHDRGKTSAQYAAGLEKVITRLQQTGARILWARTTPFGEIRTQGPGADGSIPLNAAADAVARSKGLEIIDLHAVVAGGLEGLQVADNVHFNADGARKLGEAVAAALMRHLR